jgi:hypothetical protein
MEKKNQKNKEIFRKLSFEVEKVIITKLAIFFKGVFDKIKRIFLICFAIIRNLVG